MSWTGVGGASSYELQASASTIYSGTGMSYGVSGQGNGTISYRVHACNAGGCGPWSTDVAVTTLLPPSGAPTVTAPASSSSGAYTVSWTSVGTASPYEVQENGATIYSGGATSTAISGKGSGTYTYTARACNSSGCGGWSAGASTTVTLIPATPTGAYATLDGIGGKKWQYSAYWDASPGATSYELRGYFNYTGPNTTSSTIKIGVSAPEENPSYHVRACNAAGCSAWTAYF